MKGSVEADGAEALKDAILIAGPTASGKSGVAAEIARRLGGVIVNADSMQVYSQLSILTARPGPAEVAAVPHRLYGHVDAGEAYSTGRWMGQVRELIGGDALAGRRAVFTGGTGLYFKALIEGISPMPEIPSEIRDSWRGRLALEGAEVLHGELRRRDPVAATAIRAGDGQRIVRALEVMEASGQGIAEWQKKRTAPPVDAETARMIVLEPGRDLLHRRIEARFDAMIEAGAVDEVASLLALDLDPAMPAMKAIGVPQIADYLAGGASFDEVRSHAIAATRQYAKRQMTWFRHQTDERWAKIDVGEGKTAASLAEDAISFTVQTKRI